MVADELEHQMSVAIATARVLGFSIAQQCQDHLRAHLSNAGAGPAGVTGALPLARARVARYVTAMVEDAVSAPGGPPPDFMLHETNFFAVKALWCPLWPVC